MEQQMSNYDSAYTAVACRIAGIDRQKLTDAIASGDYDCAPSTTAGRARKFEMIDLIALHTYARYTEAGWPSRLSGRIACHVKDVLTRDPDAEFVRIVQPLMGSAYGFSGSEIDPKETHLSGLPIRHHLVLDLRNTRALIPAMLAEENRTAGNPDE